MADYDLEEIREEFEKYYELSRELEGASIEKLNGSEKYRQLLTLESNLRNLVLTGEDLLEMGPTYPPLTKEDLAEEEEYQKLDGKYKDLLEELEISKEDQGTLRKMGSVKLAKIEQILQGRRGSFIDQIRDILKE